MSNPSKHRLGILTPVPDRPDYSAQRDQQKRLCENLRAAYADLRKAVHGQPGDGFVATNCFRAAAEGYYKAQPDRDEWLGPDVVKALAEWRVMWSECPDPFQSHENSLRDREQKAHAILARIQHKRAGDIIPDKTAAASLTVEADKTSDSKRAMQQAATDQLPDFAAYTDQINKATEKNNIKKKTGVDPEDLKETWDGIGYSLDHWMNREARHLPNDYYLYPRLTVPAGIKLPIATVKPLYIVALHHPDADEWIIVAVVGNHGEMLWKASRGQVRDYLIETKGAVKKSGGLTPLPFVKQTESSVSAVPA